jgi:hypothetical protein
LTYKCQNYGTIYFYAKGTKSFLDVEPLNMGLPVQLVK